MTTDRVHKMLLTGHSGNCKSIFTDRPCTCDAHAPTCARVLDQAATCDCRMVKS